jgi:hypothetical protein
MSKINDQILARRMLETRNRGYSFALFLRRNTTRYLIFFSCLGLALVGIAWLRFWTLFYITLGLLAGAVLRDIGWFRAIGKTWPFSLKVTDWDKVQKLADERDVA